MNLESLLQIFEKYSNTNLLKMRPVGAKFYHAHRQMDGQTDITKLIVAFSQFCEEATKTENLKAQQK